MSLQDKPVVLFSSCLTGEKVRYDGRSAETPLSLKLLQYVKPVKICPEVEIGFTVPRKKIFLVKKDGYRVFQEETGEDLTQKLLKFSDKFLSSVEEIDGFFLKSRSPSCGVSGTKTYRNKDGTGYIGRRRGIFAQIVKEKFPYHPVEDEERLKDFYRKYYFLTGIYLFFHYRKKGEGFVIERYSHILKMINKTGFIRFKKNPDKNSFLKIFSVGFTQKRAGADFKEKIQKDPDFRKRFVIFPEELLIL
ncbi:DUF523 domain-containing protein [Persephonella sp.]